MLTEQTSTVPRRPLSDDRKRAAFRPLNHGTQLDRCAPGRTAWRKRRAGTLVAIALVGSLLLSIGTASAGASQASPTANAPGVTSTLKVGGSTTTLQRSFFGVDGLSRPISAFTRDSSLGDYLNSTPIGMIRYGAGADSCNITSETSWSAGVSGGVATPSCPFDIASFAAWCESVGPRCQSDVELPGENNDSAEDAYYAQYIVDSLGFQPTFWSIGNEPSSWTHYGIPWTKWKITDHSTPSGKAYAVDLRNAIRAVLEVDPAAQFIGLQSYWCPDREYTDPVVSMDGGSISALACHVYPSEGITAPSVEQYFSTLIGPGNITSAYNLLRSHIQGLCATCASLPIQVSEYQGGPFANLAPEDGEFDGAIWLAASLVQALDAGIPSVQLFELQSGTGCGFCLLNTTYAPDARGLLYTDVLSQLQRGHSVYDVSVASEDTNLWATLVHNQNTGETQLLFVNANVTSKAVLGLSTKFFDVGQSGSILSWNDSTSSPQTRNYTALPSEVTVPPLSLVLVTVLSGSLSAAPVTLTFSVGGANSVSSAVTSSRTPYLLGGGLATTTLGTGRHIRPRMPAEPGSTNGTALRSGSPRDRQFISLARGAGH